MSDEVTKPVKTTSEKVMLIASIVVMGIGVIGLFMGAIVSGLLILVIGALFLPPIAKIILDKTKISWKIKLPISIVLFIGAMAGCPDDAPKTAATAPAVAQKAAVPTSSEQEMTIPESQKKFTEVVGSAKAKYQDAGDNEVKKTSLRITRGKAIKEALGGSRNVVNWVGTIRDMSTTSKGTTTLKLECEGFTIDNIILLGEDIGISPESNIFKVLSEANKGDKIYFSGTFLPADEGMVDYVDSNSMVEVATMTAPAFIMKFTGAKKR